jgi:uncharacterized damage-inducible protein DinB
MITDVESFLRFFDSVRRRTERDIAALPPAAAAWRPPPASGEAGWGIGELVGHIGAIRLYFASAYRGEGWILTEPDIDRARQETWVPWLRTSAEQFVMRMRETPAGWLTRRIEMIDTPGTLPGWRLLMMMLEHEVHHRSQIDTYAGLQGWPVPQIFERTYESISAIQPEERARHPRVDAAGDLR